MMIWHILDDVSYNMIWLIPHFKITEFRSMCDIAIINNHEKWNGNDMAKILTCKMFQFGLPSHHHLLTITYRNRFSDPKSISRYQLQMEHIIFS